MKDLFYRINEEGNAVIFNYDGTVCERFDYDDMPIVYPVYSNLSCFYQHNEGIVLSIEDVDKCGIKKDY